MTSAEMTKLVEMIAKKEDLRKQVSETTDEDALVALLTQIANDHGSAMTAEQIRPVAEQVRVAVAEGELTEAELDNIAGGFNSSMYGRDTRPGFC